MARRRHDEVVVPALTRAVVERRVVRVGAIGAGQVLPTDVARAVEELAHGARRIIRTVERRQRRAVGTVADVHPRVRRIESRRRELGAADARRGTRVEDLIPVRAAIRRAEDPRAESRRVDGARGVRVDFYVVYAAARTEARYDRAPWQKRVEADGCWVSDQREVRAAVGRLPDADRGEVRVQRERAARRYRDTADTPRGADVDRAAVDDDRADRAGVERRPAVGTDGGRRAAARLAGNTCARSEMGPSVAAVRRLVDAEAGLGVTGGVWLARSDVEGIAGGIARVERHRADRVRGEAAGDESPVRRGRKAVVGTPDAAAGSADVDAALRLTTVRRNRKRARAAGRRVVVAAERQDRREVGDAGPDQCPAAGIVLAYGQTLCFDVCPRLLGIQRVLDGHLGRGIGAVQVILLRRPEDVHLLGITRRNVVTVPTIAGLSAGSSQRLGAQLRGEGGCRASARRAVAGRQHVGCY